MTEIFFQIAYMAADRLCCEWLDAPDSITPDEFERRLEAIAVWIHSYNAPVAAPDANFFNELPF